MQSSCSAWTRNGALRAVYNTVQDSLRDRSERSVWRSWSSRQFVGDPGNALVSSRPDVGQLSAVCFVFWACYCPPRSPLNTRGQPTPAFSPPCAQLFIGNQMPGNIPSACLSTKESARGCPHSCQAIPSTFRGFVKMGLWVPSIWYPDSAFSQFSRRKGV